MARWKSLALAVLLIATIAIVPASALATDRTVTEARSYSVTVGNDDYDVYTLSSAAGRLAARVSSISGGSIDLYVFTDSELADYENPNAPSFGYEWLRENTRSDTDVSTSLTGSRHLVVDNALISASGAAPAGDVTYTITFEEVKGLDLAPFAIVLLLIIVVVVAVVVVRRRRAAAAPPPPQYGAGAPPQYGAGAPPQYGGATGGAAAPQYNNTAASLYGAQAPGTTAPPAGAAPAAGAPAGEASCPNCGAPVAFYAPKCGSCGNALNWS